MSPVTMCTCTSCVRRVPLIPNLKLRRTALVGVADFACPWCGATDSWAPGQSQWRVWRDGRDRWVADVRTVVAGFRRDVAQACDVRELVGGDQ